MNHGSPTPTHIPPFWREVIEQFNRQLNRMQRLLEAIQHKQRSNMATIEERFAAIGGRLDEASAEIIALIQSLRDTGVTPAAEAILETIETKAAALADIVPGP